MVLATSRLNLTSLELEGVALPVALLRAVTAAQVTRTTDGASTVVVTCDDASRQVLNLPVISAAGTTAASKKASKRRQTVNTKLRRSKVVGTGALTGDEVVLTFAGLAYVLVQVATGAGTTTLTFEDSTVAALRAAHGPLVADRTSVTRSEFILRLAREAGVPARVQTDERIPKLNPATALTALQSTDVDADVTDAADTGDALDSNGDPVDASADPAAPDAASTTALAPGNLSPAQIAGLLYAEGCPAAKVPTYTAIALAESNEGNPFATHHNDDGSTDYGLFQINSVHSDLLATGDKFDPAANTAMAKSVSANWTTYEPWTTYTNGAYTQYLDLGGAAASAAVGTGADGLPVTTSSTTAVVDSGKRGRVLGSGQWQRGTDSSPDETSWECVTRLAQELNWRSFSDGQTLWVGSDAWLRARRGPPLLVRENTGGVEWISGEWDPGKTDGNDLGFTTHAPWPGQPGQAATVSRMGRLSGQWVCHSFTQASTDSEAVQVTLSRAQDDVLGAVTPTATGSIVGGLTAGGETTTQTTATVLAAARSALGTPYVSGGRAPGGFDCSGLVQWCWAQAGVSIPPTTYTQQDGLPAVAGTDWLPGDLLFFYPDEGGVPGPGHVGLYIGGGQVIHAPHTGDVVRYEDVNNLVPYVSAARPVDPDAAALPLGPSPS